MATTPVGSRAVSVSCVAGPSFDPPPSNGSTEVRTTGGREYEVVQPQTRSPSCLTGFVHWIEKWTKPIREFFARGAYCFTLADWMARNPHHDVASCHSFEIEFPDFELNVVSAWSPTCEQEEVAEPAAERVVNPKRDFKTRAKQVLGMTFEQGTEPEPKNRQWRGRGRPYCRRKFR